ncbi:MAG: helix-turn-helix domain-containing protein [Acidobacteriota bacterium]
MSFPKTPIGRSRPTLKDGLSPIIDELVSRGITLAQARREFERQLIEASIRSNQGNMGRAARSLGVHRNTLRNKVTDLGIKPRDVITKTATKRPNPA